MAALKSSVKVDLTDKWKRECKVRPEMLWTAIPVGAVRNIGVCRP
jgi:hypothetical protein